MNESSNLSTTRLKDKVDDIMTKSLNLESFF